GANGGRDVVGSLEPPAGFCERGKREPVPRGDRLVVEAGLRPALTLREEPRTQLVRQLAADHRAAVLERLQELRRNTLVLGPRVRETLDAVRIRVLRGREPSLRQRELAQ